MASPVLGLVGCAAGGVVGDVGLDDVAGEVVAEVEDVVLDAQPSGDEGNAGALDDDGERDDDEDDVVVAIGETLIHEIGHYFGLSEEEIEEIEEEDRVRQRMDVIREFIEAKSKRPARPGRN